MSYGLFAALYDAGTSFALIDSRERRDYVAGHWFGSTNIPLSLFSTRLGYLFQEPDFPIHFLDWQDKASAETIHQLKAIGFNNITIHNTRKPAMMGRGFVKGEYVWSKAFGEVVAHEIDLPEVTPKQYLADYQDAQLFDVRPTAEYQDFTLPKSQSLPNSLLLANVQALKDTGKMSLLHCAGRTRSIIGAFTLMASGYDGPFAVFRGGTQAWQLDGYEREHDANRLFAADHEASDAVANFCAAGKSPQHRLQPMGLVPLLLTIKQDYYSMCRMTARLASGWRMVLSKFQEPILSSRLTGRLHATMFRLSCLTKDREAAPPLPPSGCVAWDLG